jgi:hypothetical protein
MDLDVDRTGTEGTTRRRMLGRAGTMAVAGAMVPLTETGAGSIRRLYARRADDTAEQRGFRAVPLQDHRPGQGGPYGAGHRLRQAKLGAGRLLRVSR